MQRRYSLAEVALLSRSVNQIRSAWSTASWYGFTTVASVAVTQRTALTARVEAFDDRNQVVIATGTRGDGAPNPPLRATGASLGIDVSPAPMLRWRTELRAFRNAHALFSDAESAIPTRQAVVAVSSLSLSF
jgi:hypothetical protein